MPDSPLSIVCGLDGSAAGPELTRIGSALADALDARLRLVHVLSAQALPAATAAAAAWPGWPATPPAETLHVADRHALALLDRALEAGAATGAIRHVAGPGDPVAELIAVAQEHEALLLLVGRRGLGPVGELLLGSTSRRLAVEAPCPVAIVPPAPAADAEPERWAGRPLVCGVDGSDASWRAAGQAAVLATRLGSSLITVTAGRDDAPSDEELARRLHGAVGHAGAWDRGPLYVTRRVEDGDPADALDRVAAEVGAPAVVVGSSGRHGRWRVAGLGSSARRLLRTARRVVVVVPAEAA